MMNTPTSLSFGDLEEFNKRGYIVLRSVFNKAEVAVWHAECDRLLSLDQYVDQYNLRVSYRMLNGAPMIEKFDPLRDISPVFAALGQDERILRPMRDIYLDEPRLFKDKLIFKLPGNKGYTMHQDAAYWQGFAFERLNSVMVALDGASRENGALELFPGYHDRLRSPLGEIRNMNESEIAQVDDSIGEMVETQAGDMIIFHSLTPHRSGTNTSGGSRRQLYLTYSSAKDGDLYKAHYQHYHRYYVRHMDEETKQKYAFR